MVRGRDVAVGGNIGSSASWSAVISDASGGRAVTVPESVATGAVAAAFDTEALLDSTPSASGGAGGGAITGASAELP